MKKNESKPFYLSNANPSFEKEQKLYNLMKFKNDLLNFPATFTPPLESQILRVSSKNININNYFVNHEKKKEQKSQTENIFLSKRNSDFQKVLILILNFFLVLIIS